jgi:hypothetical protein
MADGNQPLQRTPEPITEAEKARRRDTVERTDHSLRLEGMERGDVSSHAAELWINGEITFEEKNEMVRAAMRDRAQENTVRAAE